MQLIEKIREKQVHACVMGLGYVGLPLALEFVRAGYRVFGLDSDPAAFVPCERRRATSRMFPQKACRRGWGQIGSSSPPING